jgi:predicted amidohydrolase
MTVLRAAVVQLSSQDDVGENLARVRERVEEAASLGATLVGLPENFAYMGDEEGKRAIAESLEDPGPIGNALSSMAKEHRIHLFAGGMPERSSDPLRPYNTHAVFAPDGKLVARYRKIHLFDVDLPDGTSHRESNATFPGDEPVMVDVSGVRVGLSICYDLRFPELYRRMIGARVVLIPAAFTLTTGKDHWHVLLRARAIENQVFVLAPAQHGKHPRGRQTYGKSLIVDPWGDVLAQCGEGEGVAAASLDLVAQDRVRAALPCLRHRVL